MKNVFRKYSSDKINEILCRCKKYWHDAHYYRRSINDICISPSFVISHISLVLRYLANYLLYKFLLTDQNWYSFTLRMKPCYHIILHNASPSNNYCFTRQGKKCHLILIFIVFIFFICLLAFSWSTLSVFLSSLLLIQLFIQLKPHWMCLIPTQLGHSAEVAWSTHLFHEGRRWGVI